MKKIANLILVVVLSATLQAQPPSWSQLGKRIVNQIASVKPGEVVLIQGGIHTFSLMEEIAAEVHRRGAHPIVFTESDRIVKARVHDKPEANLADYPGHLVSLIKQVDYIIDLPAVQDIRATFKNQDPKREAIEGKMTERILQEMATSSRHSSVGVSFPSKEVAEISGLEYTELEKMHWAAMNADYKVIAAQGNQILKLLKGAKTVKLTTPSGTNLTFAMGNRYAFADDGVLSEEEKVNPVMFARFASLPGGWMDFAPLENSVNGTVVVPKSRCNFEPFGPVSFTVKNGIVENVKATTGQDCYEKQMAPHTGTKEMVSVFTLGLNPEFKIIQNETTDFRSNLAAGFMTLSIGGNNSQYNGAANATGGFSFPLVNPTLEIDGKVVVKNGKMVL